METFRDNTALIDSSGREISYRELVVIADEQIQKIEAQAACLIGIESSVNAVPPLITYIGAMRAGHKVILTPANGLAPGSRIRETFKPSFIFRNADEAWHFEKYGEWEPHLLHEDLSVMLPTSGTTGDPKLVRLSCQNLLSNAEAIAHYLGITRDERACMTLPWTYSYGLSVINSHLITGATVLLCDYSVSEPVYWDFFNHYQATSFAGVPYTYELLERSGFLSKTFPSLRYFTQAGGKLKPEKVVLFADYADQHHQRFYVMYGQTEASPRIAYMPPAMIKQYPSCIGQAIPGGRLGLINEKGEEIQEPETEGELVYSGPNVMMGYAAGIEDLAKGHELTRLLTGDIAIRNRAGFYQIIGRTKRFSKIFGLRINLDDIEEILKNEGIISVVAGDDVGLVIATTQKGQRHYIRDVVTQRFKLPLSSVSILEISEFPRLNSGKPDYPSILKSGREQTASDRADRDKQPLREEIAGILGMESLNDNDSFASVGGDSLNYVRVSMLLEDRLGYCPQGWETMPLHQLENIIISRSSSWVTWIDMDILIRAVAITLIVIHHVTELRMGGSAIILILIAGYNFARFQVPKLLTDGIYNVIKPLLIRILLPYFAVITIYFIVKQTVFLPQYLLISNFTYGFFENGVQTLTTWWFIETYLWLITCYSLIFKSRYLRNMASQRPWDFSLALLWSSLTLRAAGHFLPECYLFFEKTPFMLAYVFSIGWCIFISKTIRQRIIITIIILAIVWTLSLKNFSIDYTFNSAWLLLTWIPAIPVNKWIAKLLSVIALSSLYIYITHGFIIHSARGILNSTTIPQTLWLVMIPSCLLFGIFTSWVVDTYRFKSH